MDFAAKVKLALFVATIIGFAGCFAAGYYKGRVDTAAQVKVETVTKVVEIVRQKNEIRNHRPEPSQLVDSLKNGTF